MWCFNQIEDLVPMSWLKGVSSKVLQEFDYQRGLLNLEHHNLIEGTTLILEEIVLRELFLKISVDLIDASDDFIGI